MKILERQKLNEKLRKLLVIENSKFAISEKSLNYLAFSHVITFFSFYIPNLPVLYSISLFLLTNLIGLFYFTEKLGFYSQKKLRLKKLLKIKKERLINKIEEHSFENNFDLYFEEIKELKKNNKIHLIDDFVLQSFIYQHKKYKENQQKKNNKFSYFNDVEKEEEKNKITIT